ncbi:hypothetical protein A2625_07640 [candidate division WOR-1 bacterium RIFCSPHIGHO2_01_FULL_53_15]|uniref:Uncharacterized protein n=1 Tax=candidate division WOR-1 bacterium RIFCSPHIGHO2_01_FULL_53_15 TaxID=1802564 RepID=A0A1F4Q4L1_UNCSA|nr:MAG: hypothetical protein A2625_07640 [candidate division WOR-1 bacterium RIFCSPHIGHO2_01_FULL_53_15]OGC10554.1 MAG: hypothetical protein A3D23_01525 [candidate division WOR-1 bacterium RIFCSPHIGHO2_02_FULL_53_26]
MGFYYKNTGSSSATMRKPSKPLNVNTPLFDRFHLHNTETETGFKWIGSRVNFLMEMLKFMPTFEQVMYGGEPEADYNLAVREYGNATESYYLDPDPTPDDGVNDPNMINFGAVHRVSANGVFWGTYMGTVGRNLDFHPTINEFNHFEELGDKFNGKDKAAKDMIGATSPDSALNITSLLGNPDSALNITSLLGNTVSNYSSNIWGNDKVLAKKVKEKNDKGEWTGNWVDVSTLTALAKVESIKGNNSIKDKSFYQMIMDRSYADSSYASFSNDQAFRLMVLMLESRRRIFYAMNEVFGDPRNIYNYAANPNDSAMISAFDSWAGDPNKGKNADPHNVQLLALFLENQHAFGNWLSATVTGQGFMYSQQDKDQFAAFRTFMSEKTLAYKNWINNVKIEDDKHDDYYYEGIGAFNDQVNALYSEYWNVGGYVQPYLNRTGVESTAGWDHYSQTDPSAGPEVNPFASDAAVIHKDYSVTQMFGINFAVDRLGTVIGNDGTVRATGLASTNWVVHHILGLLRYGDRDVGRNFSIKLHNRANKNAYKKATQEYYDEKDEMARDEARMAAAAKGAAAKHKADLAKIAGQARKSKDELKMTQSKPLDSRINLAIQRKKNKENKS